MSSTTPPPNNETIPLSESQERWILILIGSVVFASVVNASMVNVALPSIKEHFAISEGTASWIVTGYLLTFGIFNAINGRLADIFGRRRIYLIGISILGITAGLIAISNSVELTIGLRVLQGAGAAALPSVGSTIIAEVVPIKRRGAAMGIIMSTAGLAASIGPFIGGFLAEYISWRAVFGCTTGVLLMLPICLKVLPEQLNTPNTHRFDYIGAILLSLSVGSFFYGFHIVQDSGLSNTTFLSLGISAFFLIAFSIWILRHKHPFILPEVMKDIRYICSILVASGVNATRFGTIVLVPIFLAEVNHFTPSQIAIVLLPGALTIAILARYAGQVADRFGPRLPVTLGVFLIIFGDIVSAIWAGESAFMVGLGMALYGVGYAALETPLETSISHIMPKRLVGVALGLFLMVFFISGAVGVAFSSTIVEIQPVGTPSWLGLTLKDARYSNAILALNGIAICVAFLIPFLPKRDSLPKIQ